MIAGGGCDDSVGYYVQPTLFKTNDPQNKMMTDDIFGPVLTAYVYDDNKLDETIDLVDKTSVYGLTEKPPFPTISTLFVHGSYLEVLDVDTTTNSSLILCLKQTH
ncbi:unnamed protein product [Dibothriocephalus latus]|uniref:Aldehyde dehydrogenase domain-containing protein n=1 Tax=Dibothriocephalus latus TaxID=60516 RepID=A0A3P7MN87_DIBLA|nr:unnamed protein product [Dibothriocephalus latus]